MRFSVAAAAATLLSVASVQAADHLVQVGAGGQLVFSPSEVDGAVVGDTVSFQFQGKNHTVTQSSFIAPCTPLAGGVDSGFQPVAAGAASLPQFTFNITNATAPLWFFCRQTNPVSHCGSGMVFALNPTAAKNFTTFQTTANATLTGTSTTSGTTGVSTTGTAGSTATTSTTPTTSAPASGALKLGGSAAGAMTLAALVLGLTL